MPDPGRASASVGSNVKVGYFAQYRVDMLDAQHTVLQEAQDTPIPVNEQARADRARAVSCSAATTCSSPWRC